MKIGFTCGVFDLFHVGHVYFLSECAKHCDWLIVGLQTDPTIDRPEKNKPVQTMFERWTQLESCAHVNHVIPYDTEADLFNLIAITPFSIRFLGGDYIGKFITGEQLCTRLGIEIMYIDRYHEFSSTELRKRVYNAEHCKITF